jgi:hypothetical protein
MGLNSRQREAGLFAGELGRGEGVEHLVVRARLLQRVEKPGAVGAGALSVEGKVLTWWLLIEYRITCKFPFQNLLSGTRD